MKGTVSGDTLAVKKRAWSGTTRVYMLVGGDAGTHEERFAREVVDRVQLEQQQRAEWEMRVEASGKVAELLREGLVGLGCSVVERTALGGASRVVVVGIVGGKEETVGESVLYVSRVGVVWLVDAHWTLAEYCVWVKTEDDRTVSGGLASDPMSLWSVVPVGSVLGALVHVMPILKEDLAISTGEQLGNTKEYLDVLKGQLEGLVSSAKGADMDNERRGVLVRGLMKVIGAVDGKVRAIEEAIVELSIPPTITL